MNITDKKTLAIAYKQGPYAFPGGYPLFLLLSDGETLCWKCFKSEYRSIQESVKDQLQDGWNATAIDINYEDGDMYCAHCNDKIDSAYGETEEEELKRLFEESTQLLFNIKANIDLEKSENRLDEISNRMEFLSDSLTS